MADVDFKGASLSKIVPAHRKTIEFTWLHRTFMLFGKFKDARTRMRKMTMVGYEHCHWCRKPFEDADMMVLAGRPKGGQRTAVSGLRRPSITCAKRSEMTTLKKFTERLERQADDGHHWDRAPQMLRDAAANIRMLHGALVLYGCHLKQPTVCPAINFSPDERGECTCGLTELMTTASETGAKHEG